MIATSLRRSTLPVVAILAAAALALATFVAASAQTSVVTTRADTTVDVGTNVSTGTGASTQLGDLTLTATGTEMTTTGDIRIVAPEGWSFDTASDVSFTVGANGALRIGGATSGTVNAESANALTLDVTADSAAGDTLTLSGISVRPNAETTATGNLGLSLDADADVSNGPNDVADISTLTISGETGGGVTGAFDRPLDALGVNPAVWNGGTAAELDAAVTSGNGVSATIFSGGEAYVYIPGAPAFVNSAFNTQFSGNIEAGTIVLVTR